MVFLKCLVAPGFDRINVHAAAFAVETDLAVDEGEDGVISPETDILAGQELRAALADDDVAGDDGLAAEFFHAETLANAVASVLNTALTFFMCHKLELFGFLKRKLQRDAGDLELGQFAAVADGAVVALAAAKLESDHFLVLLLRDDFSRHRDTLEGVRAGFAVLAVRVKEHVGEGGFLALLEVKFLHFDHVTCGDFVLFAACFDNCVCHKFSF